MTGGGGIGATNRRAQARAAGRGDATFTCLVVDSWPACTTCGDTIRHRGDGDGHRRCGCPGRLWRCGLHGWKIVAPEPT